MGRGNGSKAAVAVARDAPKPNEIALRVSFLQQAAKLMVEKSVAKNDTPALLSKLYVEELQEVKNVQQTLLSTDFRRFVCRRCNRIWVPNGVGDNGVHVEVGKKRVYRQCADCRATASFARNSKYRSRNEKAKCVSTSTSTDLTST